MESYDVIIIGTGAGGGTLARHLAPSGKRILLLERGDWLPREPQNWDAADVFADNRYISEDTWYDDKGKTVPAADPLLRRRGDQALRRGALPTPQGGLRRASAPRRRLARMADRVRGARAVLHAGRAPLRGARRPRGGPDRAAGERAVPLSGGLPRAPDPAALGRPRRRGTPPVPRAVRHPAERGEHALQPLRPLPDLRRIPLSRPCEVGRRGARRAPCARASQRHAPDEREGDETRDGFVRRAHHGGRRRARRRDRALRRRHRRRRLRRREHGKAPPRVGERPPPERARERVRPGRPQLHVPRQHRGARALP